MSFTALKTFIALVAKDNLNKAVSITATNGGKFMLWQVETQDDHLVGHVPDNSKIRQAVPYNAIMKVGTPLDW
jgi:hypothetical protein